MNKNVDSVYFDGGELVVHPKFDKSKGISVKYAPGAPFKGYVSAGDDVVLKDILDAVEYSIGPAPAPKVKQVIEIPFKTRAIVTVHEKVADEIKKQVHNAKEKIQVRIMDRKGHKSVYIDTATPEALDAAIVKVKAILNQYKVSF